MPHRRLQLVLIALGLALSVLAVFAPVGGHEFVNYDDPEYVTENPRVQAGLTPGTVAWAFGAVHACNWHPVTWLSHALDCELFGLNPRGHHWVSLLFHLADTLLLGWVFLRLTGALWPSAGVAALFALHPMHVESVAWVAERKDVLSTFFLILTIWAYAVYVERKGFLRYGLVLLLFALGLMSKPMLVTTPFLLLLLDYWPLRRVSFPRAGLAPDAAAAPTSETNPPISLGRLVLEKLPLFALVLGSIVITFVAQQSEGAVVSAVGLTPGQRFANALVSYVRYLGKMFWPDNLAVFYPHPERLPAWQVVGAALFLITASAWVVWNARRRPHWFTGWFWFLGTLVPVIGLVQVGAQAMADRYTYVPYIGLFALAAWELAALTSRRPAWKLSIAAASALAVASAAVASGFQLQHWRNSTTLFTHALRCTRDNSTAHINLGSTLLDQGRVAEAGPHFAAA